MFQVRKSKLLVKCPDPQLAFKVEYNRNTFGITQLSLMMLRDTLAEHINHTLVVVEVPTSDLVCGFLILDYTIQEAIFTGDGFRSDRGGEGGAAYRAASALFAICGIDPILWDVIDILPAGPALDKQLLNVAREVAAEGYSAVIPLQQAPAYIDHCIAK